MSPTLLSSLTLRLADPPEPALGVLVRLLAERVIEGPRALREQLRDAPPDDLPSLPGSFWAKLDEIVANDSAERERESSLRHGHTLADVRDPDYPRCLLDLPGPPAVLSLRGEGPWPPRRAVTIVGARRSTALARGFAAELGEACAGRGIPVISGLAIGIDQAGHEGALRAGGATHAVLACGLDRIYPPGATRLSREVEAAGRLVSEMPLGTPPLRHHFPRRNRLLAALSASTLVLQADLRSGSLITARLAAEIGRQVYAVPGSIDQRVSRGTNRLLRDGAHPLLGLEDLEWIVPQGEPRREGAADEGAADEGTAKHPVLDALDRPLGLVDLARRTGLDADALVVQLTDWEAEGRIQRLGGGLYCRS